MVFLYFFFFNNLGKIKQDWGHSTSCWVRGLHPARSFLQPVMAAELSEKGLGEGLSPSLLTHVYCTTHSVYSLLLSRFHGIAKGAEPSGRLVGALKSFSRDCQREFCVSGTWSLPLFSSDVHKGLWASPTLSLLSLSQADGSVMSNLHLQNYQWPWEYFICFLISQVPSVNYLFIAFVQFSIWFWGTLFSWGAISHRFW